MKFDSYNRFLKSDIYKECATAENSGKMFPFEDDIDEEFRHKVCCFHFLPSLCRTETSNKVLNVEYRRTFSQIDARI